MSASAAKLSTRDVVAKWEIPLCTGVYSVEFEHGTATGQRGIFINGKCIRREEFKFALIGEEHFKVSDVHCTVQIRPINSMDYGYFLLVNGTPFEQFLANQAKQLKCWLVPIAGEPIRVVLRLDSMDIFSNGEQLESTGEFSDSGSETHFELRGSPCFIRISSSCSSSSGRKRGGGSVTYSMFHGNKEVPEAAIDQIQTWDAQW